MENRATNIAFSDGMNQVDWQLLDELCMPVALLSSGRLVVNVNRAYERLTGLKARTVVGRPCCEVFCGQADGPTTCLFGEQTLTEKKALTLQHVDGTRRHLKASVTPVEAGHLLQLLDVTGEINTQRKLQRLEDQDQLLFSVLQRLLALPVRDIDDGIDYALAELGAFLQVDRCYLFNFDQKAQAVSNSHEWVSSYCQPEIDNLKNVPVADLAWFWSYMVRSRPLIVRDVSLLPEAAATEKEHWQSQKIQSLLVVPLTIEGSLYGFLGVDAVQDQHAWRKSELALLDMVGEFLCSLLERRTSSLARANSDQRFSALADAAPALIWEIDNKGHFVYGNRAWQDFVGNSEGSSRQDGFVHQDELSTFKTRCLLCMNERKIVSMELRLRRADGEYRWMQVTGAPLKRETGAAGMIISAFDVTDHKMAEDQLLTLNEDLERRVVERTAELEKKNVEMFTLTRAIEQSPCSIVITDLAGTIEYVNPKFTEVTGYLPEEALGQNPRVLKGEDGHTDYALMWQTLAAGSEWRGEFHNRRKNGEYFWEMASITPITDRDGQVRQYLAVKEDITRRKQLEQTILSERDELKDAQTELQKAYDELKATQSHLLQQEKMASIGQLAAGVAHEINNPVGFIKSNLATLGKYVGRIKEFTDLQKEVLQTVASEAQQDELSAAARRLKVDYLFEDIPDLVEESIDGAERVKTIVQNLKSFSRVDQTQYCETDLNECLESTINMVWNELKYKVTLNRQLGDLPRIKCYPQQLNQVFMNILVNGSQAIEEKGVIDVETRIEGDNAVISIRDDGCGIAPEHLGRIFEPFFTTKDVGKGTGLGMSISYDIIKKHAGDLRVESCVGKGTSFEIILPLTGAPAPDDDRDQLAVAED